MASAKLDAQTGLALLVENLPSSPSRSTLSTAAIDGLTNSTSEMVLTKDPSVNADSIPPHLSHDPENNLKRSDPFQFGSRLLSQEDNVFEFNAWDHVETDDTYKEYAELQYAKQREVPVSDFDKSTSYFFFFSIPLSRILMIQKCIVHLKATAHERNKFSNVFRSYLICFTLSSLPFPYDSKSRLTNQ